MSPARRSLLILVAIVGLTAGVSASFRWRSVPIHAATPEGLWLLADRAPRSDAAARRRSFGANGRLGLPFRVYRGPLRLFLLGEATVRGTLVVGACGRVSQPLLIPAGQTGRYAMELPEPATACALELSFAFEARPLARGEHAVAPSLRVDGVELEAPGGLGLRPGSAWLVSLVPLLAFGLFSWKAVSRRRRDAFTSASAAIALILLLGWPLRTLLLVPLACLGALALAGGAHRRLARGAARIARWSARNFDAVVLGSSVNPPSIEPSRGGGRNLLGDLALALVPVVVAGVLVAALFGKTFFDHVPASSNDAVDYWLESASFAQVGFRGGYFGVNEKPPAVDFSRFGAHGPAFPLIYGGIGRALGWRPYSAVLIHAVLVTAGLLLFLRRAQLDGRQRWLALMCLLTFWPVIMFVPSSLQEGFHFAVAATLAALAVPALEGRAVGAGARALALALVVIATLVRPSWAALLPPAALWVVRPRSWRLGGAVFVAAALAGAGIVWAYDRMAAPFPGTTSAPTAFFVRVATLETSVQVVRNRYLRNVAGFLEAGGTLAVLERLLIVTVGLVSAAWAVASRNAGMRREAALHAYNLLALFAGFIATYRFSGWRDYRVLSVHLFLSALLLIGSRNRLRGTAVLITAVHAASAGLMLPEFQAANAEPFSQDPSRIEALRAALRGVVAFREGQDGWCNTLAATSYPFYYPEMVALPPGIGVVMLFPIRPPDVRPPLKSRYVLVPDGPPDAEFVTSANIGDGSLAQLGSWSSLNLQRLTATPIGTLYENRDARCPPS